MLLKLDYKSKKMAVSLSDPFWPKPKLQILTTTLRILNLQSMSGYSKASRVFSSNYGYPASSLDTHFHRTSRWDSCSIVIPFMHVRTYLTRNYAQCCYSMFQIYLHILRANITLIVTYEFGLYLIKKIFIFLILTFSLWGFFGFY